MDAIALFMFDSQWDYRGSSSKIMIISTRFPMLNLRDIRVIAVVELTTHDWMEIKYVMLVNMTESRR